MVLSTTEFLSTWSKQKRCGGLAAVAISMLKHCVARLSTVGENGWGIEIGCFGAQWFQAHVCPTSLLSASNLVCKRRLRHIWPGCPFRPGDKPYQVCRAITHAFTRIYYDVEPPTSSPVKRHEPWATRSRSQTP
uniref:15 kDa protein n=1 Tax=Rice virus X TaxID=106518 RepID=Q9IR20_9TOMB|nr:15 kDa protein [Rice virus X]